MTKPGHAKAEAQGEQGEALDALEGKVAEAAEAAATAAAHAVAAAKAAEEVSKAREEAEEKAAEEQAAQVLSGDPTPEPVGDDEPGDLLNLDAPHVAMPSVLSRLALMALGSAAAIFVVSIVLVTTVPKGTVFDVIVLVTWLGVGFLSLGGFALLAAAGITKVVKSENRA